MIAGRDTTSSALTWFFWLLSNNPDVETKVLAELRENLPSSGGGGGHHPSAADLKRLAYLHAALSESLRLYPPVLFEHKAGAQPDTLPSGPAVRPWRRVIVSFYSMGRMEAVWGKDCLEFRPERWLTAAGRLRPEPSYKFVAFNLGPRTCIGKELAFTQMKAVVAAVLPRFRVEVAPGAPAVKPKLSIILHMKDGLKVRVYKRQGGASQGYVRRAGLLAPRLHHARAPLHAPLRRRLPAPAAAALPPGKAVAVYYQAAANRPFAFLGALGPARPSATFQLPEAGDEPEPPAGPAKLGVAVEDAAALPTPPDEQRAERVALRVGENLFNFMQSFCAADGGKLVVPTDILDRWFRKFQERAKKDPTYLKSFDF
ncbi:hypothetical protein ZWY2020_007870 [Hordeum vulgare]|nr:hypothetical protein ZWY2020_007870 [Hordeum vulgare]